MGGGLGLRGGGWMGGKGMTANCYRCFLEEGNENILKSVVIMVVLFYEYIKMIEFYSIGELHGMWTISQ